MLWYNSVFSIRDPQMMRKLSMLWLTRHIKELSCLNQLLENQRSHLLNISKGELHKNLTSNRIACYMLSYCYLVNSMRYSEQDNIPMNPVVVNGSPSLVNTLKLRPMKWSCLIVFIASTDAVSPAVFLIRKLIAVLEMSERLPVFSFESMGSGLQILTRRLRFRLERAPGEGALIDRSGRNLRIEPLTTVEALKNHLSRMVSRYH